MTYVQGIRRLGLLPDSGEVVNVPFALYRAARPE